MEPNLAGSIYIKSSINFSFGFIGPTNMAAVTKNRTYGKIARFGNNSKTVNNIRNLTGSK
jgi:hypothetical protein